MSVSTVVPKPEPGGLTGRHVLFAFLGFFGVIFAVNGYFLYSALSTYTGTVANEPYRKGLAYNSRIAADERQSELKWTDTIELVSDGTVSMTIAGPDNRKLDGLVVSGVLSRPATSGFDHALKFTEVEPGRYSAKAGKIDGGNWLAVIEVRMAATDKDPTYRTRRRLWLKP
jgi:nitrogen fixation protein FixH